MNNFCTNCGNKVEGNAYVCTHCGVKLNNDVQSSVSDSHDNGGFGWSVLGFFVPLVGLILYLVWKNERPKTAKAAGKGALTYVIVYVIIMIIAFVIGFIGGFTEEIIDENNSYYDYEYEFE